MTKVINYIEESSEEQINYAFDIFNHYAAEVVKYFIQVQTEIPAETRGDFWTNHTFKAAKAFFTSTRRDKDSMVLTMTYNLSKAPYIEDLELHYQQRFAALPSLLNKFYPMIVKDLKMLYGDE